MNWLLALFEALKAGFTFATKVTPSEKIQEERHEEKKELREQDLNQELINDGFRYLKRRVEIDSWDYVRNTHPKMSIEEMVLYHKILHARVVQYRKDLVNRKGIGWKKMEDWLNENGVK